MSEAEQTVGQTVARARTDAGMTLAQVAAVTRIRATLLLAIENDDFRLCGGDVYARGHLKSIATAVGVDPVDLVNRFDAAYGAAHREVSAVDPIEQPTHLMDDNPARGLGALAGTLGASIGRSRTGHNWSAVMALALAVIVGVGLVSFLTNRPASSPVAGGPAVSSTATPSPSGPTPSSTPSGQPAPSGSPTGDVVASADGVAVTLTVTGRASWMRVTSAGGKTLYEGTLTKGETKNFTDKTKVGFVIGDAGAVALTVNGRDLGAPGASGQVVKVAFVPGDPTGQAA